MSESPRLSRSKNGFPHFMLKEIYEQPAVLRRLIADCSGEGGAGKLPGVGFSDAQIRAISKITIAASGSSRHAGMVGEFMLERMTALPGEVALSSQDCYRTPATKRSTAKLAALLPVSAFVAPRHGKRSRPRCNAVCGPAALPEHLQAALGMDQECRKFAAQLYRYKDFISLGRDLDYPIALEGALKLKEISYIHADGYPTGALKPATTALVHEEPPLLALAPHHNK